MKLRQGFVSNSSSSSYLIQVNERPEKCEHCGHRAPDFISAMEQACAGTNDPDGSYIHTSLDSLKSAVQERISWYQLGEPSWEELVSVYKNLEDGGTYAWIQVGYHNEPVNELGSAARTGGE